jgi:O-antigen/teichoic acid export membrane protein
MITSLENIWRWGGRGSLTVLDQGIFSGTSFIVTIMLARWLDSAQFGAFAVGLSILAFFLQIHTSILLEPMAVVGPSSYHKHLHNYLAMQIRLHFYLAVPAGGLLILLAVACKWIGLSKSVTSALVAIGLWLSFLLLPWLTRRIFYVLGNPSLALLGSFIYAFLAISGILYAEKHALLNTQSAILVLAGASLISSLVLMTILARLTDMETKMSSHQVLVHNWRFGRPLILAGFLIALSGQSPVFLASMILGLQQAGAMRAINVLIQPMILATTAITAIAIPKLAYEYASGNRVSFLQNTRLVSLVMIGLSVLFEILLIFFSVPIEQIVYKGRFSEYATVLPYWGVVTIILAGTSGMQAAFHASRKPEGMLIAAAFWTPVCFGLGYWLTTWWGIWGLTVSTVIGYLVLAAVFGYLFWRWFYFIEQRFSP